MIDSTFREARKETNGVSTNGVIANLTFFDRGTFWVPPLTYFYLPKSTRVYLFPQSVEIRYFRSGPISVDPTCPQPTDVVCYRCYTCACISSMIIIIIIIIIHVIDPICPRPRQGDFPARNELGDGHQRERERDTERQRERERECQREKERKREREREIERGNHLSNTTCLTKVFFRIGEYLDKVRWSLTL